MITHTLTHADPSDYGEVMKAIELQDSVSDQELSQLGQLLQVSLSLALALALSLSRSLPFSVSDQEPLQLGKPLLLLASQLREREREGTRKIDR